MRLRLRCTGFALALVAFFATWPSATTCERYTVLDVGETPSASEDTAWLYRFCWLTTPRNSDLLESQPEISLVGTATDFSEAVLFTALVRPNVVLLDLRMKDSQGLDALGLVHKSFQRVHNYSDFL